MSPPDDTDPVVWLDDPGPPDDVDLMPYAGQFIAWSVDNRRVVVAAAELPDFLDQLRQRDERGEPYVIGGWVPPNPMPIL